MNYVNQNMSVQRVWRGDWLRIVGVSTAILCGVSAGSGQVHRSSTAVSTSSGGSRGGIVVATSGSNQTPVVVDVFEPNSGTQGRQPAAWLGVAVEEGSEALGAQLGLEPGVGLVITMVTADSPAEKAGLKKNDVLVELEDQALVHPAQFRKLLQVRKEGDKVKLVYFRAGQKETATATLGKASQRLTWVDEDGNWQGTWREFQRQLHDLPVDEHMKSLREAMGNIKIDQKKVQEEVSRSLEEARKAYEAAIRHAGSAGAKALRKTLDELGKSGVLVDNDASVTVRSTEKSVRSMVTTDDSGTIILVANPKIHLTAHDKDGKLLFDGLIDTAEERAKVPNDLLKKVEPMVDKLKATQEHQKQAEDDKAE